MQAIYPLPRESPAPGLEEGLRPVVQGKFFFLDGRKLYLRGVSYGPFAPASHGAPLPEPAVVERDLALIAGLGANCLRTFTVPPSWFLDRAAAHGLRVLATVPWAQHVCFLDKPRLVAQIRRTVADAARAVGRHPALFALLIGNEIPPDIVRWYGARRVAEFLRSLSDEVKESSPEALTAYANFPSTEYLDLDFLDFVAFNVYLHRKQDFRRYISRLHNIAEDKPLVLTEFGVDSLREGLEAQADMLSWQVRASFEGGVAGTFVFSWTDDWFTGGAQVTDWAFGLVDAERRPKPAFHAVQRAYREPLPPPLERTPSVSVVVCAANAERTLEACLEALRQLRYPDYEVILVNDGSRDRTREIAERFRSLYAADPKGPRFTIIDQGENRGLGAARNAGLAAARGEIVAYTDADCVPDPDWLTYLVYPCVRRGFVAVGGPNFPPPEPSLVPAAVAVSPGGPTHVLLDDEIAEHVPGCNMAFMKSALVEIGGFEPVFTAAGDDVDMCWRLQNRGYAIGFSPAAVVWHFRRNTVGAYLKQQMGYGKAEALLYFKHPYRFNMLGQSRWLGRVYGDLTLGLLLRRPVVYFGAFGRGLFQTMYEPPSSLLGYLPFTVEWNVVAVVLFLSALTSARYLVLAAMPLAVSVVWSLASAMRARIDPRFRGLRSRLLVALLTWLGPVVRGLQRYLWRLQGLSEVERVDVEAPGQPVRVRWWRRELRLAYWSERAVEKENLLHALMEFLIPRKYLVGVDPGWNPWDIEVYRGIWARGRLTVAVENHGGQRRLLNTRVELRLTRFSVFSLLGYLVAIGAGMLFGVPELVVAATALGAATLVWIALENGRLGKLLYHALELTARRIQLVPVPATRERTGLWSRWVHRHRER